MPALRILHVTPYFGEAWAYGGIPRVATAVTRALAERGHHVTVYTTDARSQTQRAANEPSVPVARTATPAVRAFPNVSNVLAYHAQFFTPRGMRAYVRAHARNFDIAHVHACHNLPGAIAADELARARIPFVLSPHGTGPRIERRRMAKWAFDATLGRNSVRAAARVVAVSFAEARQLAVMGIDERRLVVIANPLDLGQFDPPVEHGHLRRRHNLGFAPLVVFLGKLTPRKRLDVLARAFAELRVPGARLIIAGNDMGYERQLRHQIDRLGIADRTIFTGVLAGRARLEALADADVVSYVSRDEAFGLVPLEALMCGTPVVVADDNGCGEIIRDTGGGLVVPEGDHLALARALTTILGDGTAWRAETVKARMRIRDHFAADTVCEQLERMYDEVLNR